MVEVSPEGLRSGQGIVELGKDETVDGVTLFIVSQSVGEEKWRAQTRQ